MTNKSIKNDHAAKILFKDPQTAADLINGYFFSGKPVIKSADITEADPVLQLDGSYRENRKIKELLADKLFRICQVSLKEGRCLFGFAGIQNQTHVDYSMPIRDLQVITAVLTDELRRLKKQNEEIRKGSTIFSPIKKKEKLPGVVVLTLFFSTERWDGFRNLSELVNGGKEFYQYMANVRCNLIVPSEMSEEKCLEYGNTLGPIFLSLKSAHSANELKAVMRRYEDLFDSVSEETFDVINSVLNLGITYNKNMKGGTINMCNAIQEIREEGRLEGRLEGRQEGMATAKHQYESEQEKTVLRFFDFGDGLEKISIVLNIPEEKIRQILLSNGRHLQA